MSIRRFSLLCCKICNGTQLKTRNMRYHSLKICLFALCNVMSSSQRVTVLASVILLVKCIRVYIHTKQNNKRVFGSVSLELTKPRVALTPDFKDWGRRKQKQNSGVCIYFICSFFKPPRDVSRRSLSVKTCGVVGLRAHRAGLLIVIHVNDKVY